MQMLRCRFVISYFLADDTLAVFEPPQRNSGIPGGRTADRGKVRRPAAGPLDYYRPCDMRIGRLAPRGTLRLRSCQAGRRVGSGLLAMRAHGLPATPPALLCPQALA
jgi:hypothetical protein